METGILELVVIMCSPACLKFAETKLSKQDIEGKKILEVGSYDVNGSVRQIIEDNLWLGKPAEYIGVDITPGPRVDMLCDAENLMDIFSEESFDVVISTELLEHVVDPKKVISNMKRVCKRNGIILITTRSRGFPFHGYPNDFWRFELSDMQQLFSDCEITDLEKDLAEPGVFIKVWKPDDFIELDKYSSVELYKVPYQVGQSQDVAIQL